MSDATNNALEDFLIRNQAALYRLAFSYLKQPEDAMDAVQTAACLAIEKQGYMRNPASVRAWFYRILVNVCLDALRQKGRFVSLSEWEDAGYEDPAPADETLALRIDRLPTEMGTVIKLRFYEELSLKEIAVVTGSNVNTVKSRLYGGLKKLKLFMEGAEIK